MKNQTRKEKLLSQFIRIKSKSKYYKVIVQSQDGVQLDNKFYSLDSIVKSIKLVNPAFEV